MNNCELCSLQARTYCEADQATLCWGCDSKVHGANFLVARHSRTLLCHLCHSLTPWKASGEKLGHTVSVCESCVNGQEVESPETNGDDIDDDEEEEEEEEEDEAEGENHAMPWSTLPATPPPACDSSSSEDDSNSVDVFSVKRRRLDALHSQDDHNGCSSERKYGTELLTVQVASVDSAISSKEQETVPYRSKSAAIIFESRKRIRNQRDEGIQ